MQIAVTVRGINTKRDKRLRGRHVVAARRGRFDTYSEEGGEAKTSARSGGWSDRPRTPKTPYDPDKCPAGYDPEVWSLGLLFDQLAKKRGVTLAARMPVIHGVLLKRFARFRELVQEKPRKLLDSKGVIRPWTDFVSATIRDYWTPSFWGTEYDEYALDDYCDCFLDIGRKIAAHAENVREGRI
jgi:hypothetical protein